jgi:hypothetical protein
MGVLTRRHRLFNESPMQRESKDRRAFDVDNAELRSPSWLDVVTLAAVVAAVVAFYQCGWVRASPRHFPSDGNLIVDGLHEARRVLNAVMPVSFGLAIVGFVRVLREPRQLRSLLFRQPGVAACAAMVAALITAGANAALWLVRSIEFQEAWLSNGFLSMVLEIAARHVSFCVLAVWAYLAFGGLWASGRNWVNWVGGTLGVLAILNSVLWCLP